MRRHWTGFAMSPEEIDIGKTVLAILTSGLTLGGLYALVKKLVKRAGAAGWQAGVGVWVAKVDLDKLRKEAAAGREAKAKADAVIREAEARVAKHEAVANQCRQHCEQARHERDELALRLARADMEKE